MNKWLVGLDGQLVNKSHVKRKVLYSKCVNFSSSFVNLKQPALLIRCRFSHRQRRLLSKMWELPWKYTATRTSYCWLWNKKFQKAALPAIQVGPHCCCSCCSFFFVGIVYCALTVYPPWVYTPRTEMLAGWCDSIAYAYCCQF